MEYKFQHKRNFGLIKIDDFGAIRIEFCDSLLKKKIIRIFEKEVKPPVITQHPGINEITRAALGKKITKRLKVLEEKAGIWIWHSDFPLHQSPWFSTEGFEILKFNNCSSDPWFLIEDIATGCQAFCKPWSTSDKYLWLPKSLENAVEDWSDCKQRILRFDELRYGEQGYTFLRWNDKYGKGAKFVVRDNITGKQSMFTPGRCENLLWTNTDLANSPEMKEWAEFGNEMVEDLESIAF